MGERVSAEVLTVHRPRLGPDLPPLADCAEVGCETSATDLYAHDTDGHPVYRCSEGHMTRVIPIEGEAPTLADIVREPRPGSVLLLPEEESSDAP